MPGTYILIPAYNEEKSIAKIIVDASKYGNVIVCDDGSSDYTGVIAERLGAIVIRHDRNLGYGAALKSLFRKVLEYEPDIVVTLDADLQHDPNYIPLLIDALEDSGADIVIGSRDSDDETPKYRRIGIELLSKALSDKVRDVQSGFRVYRGGIIRFIIPSEDDMSASIEILERALRNDFKIVEVPIRIRYKGLDTSTYNPLTHGYQLFSRIIHSRIIRKPITYLAIPGILLILSGFISGIWVVMRYIEVKEVAIGTAIITAILLIVGFIFIMVAIQLYAIKEYMKMYERSV